ncbi:unnamed protein product [Amoebophrya sp. A25]|nr:unnamed protein product [Amoebophrya sp. A25]|eukprot:GSA25T00022885001.1
MSSVAGSLCEICDAIAGKFGLNPDEVLRVAAGQIGQVGVLNGQIGAGGQVGGRLNSLVPSSKVLRKEISEASSQVEDDDEDRTGRPLNLMNKDDAGNSSSYPELCSVTDVVELPRGKNLQDMTLEDLQKTIQAQKKRSVTEEDTKAIPFLLRFCLGEFQYGQGTVAGSVQSNQNSLTSNHRQKKPILSGTTFGDNLSASSGTPPATFTPQQRAAAGLTTVLGVGSISNKLSIYGIGRKLELQ